MSKQFKHVVVGGADFANGSKYQIVQIKASGACRIIDLLTGKFTYSGTIPNAWKSVCFQADLDWRTNRTG